MEGGPRLLQTKRAAFIALILLYALYFLARQPLFMRTHVAMLALGSNTVSVSASAAVARYNSSRIEYHNKADFVFVNALAGALGASVQGLGACSSGSLAFFVAGINEGQLTLHALAACPSLTVLGLEINREMLAKAEVALQKEGGLARYPNVHFVNAGLADRDAEVTFAVMGSASSIMDPNDVTRTRMKGWPVSKYRVRVMPLPLAIQTYLTPLRHAPELVFSILDLEGHEPLAIEGMQLVLERNARAFSAFQFEIGGTWAERDPRRPLGAMSLPDVVEHLDSCGYELYMIGEHDVLRVPPLFFTLAAWDSEGFGVIVPEGNVLAIHRTYAHPLVRRFVDSRVFVHEAL
jgi:hypothetical protein